MNTIIDLFSGAGGLELGFEEKGFETVLSVDSLKEACDTIALRRKKPESIVHVEMNMDNIESIVAKFKGVDGIIGGPPCQNFSSLRRKDSCIDKIDLPFVFLKAVEIVQPKFFVMENVVGIKSYLNGEYIRLVFNKINEMGYDFNAYILDAYNFGVPQMRRRVFIIGQKIKAPVVFAHFDYPEHAPLWKNIYKYSRFFKNPSLVDEIPASVMYFFENYIFENDKNSEFYKKYKEPTLLEDIRLNEDKYLSLKENNFKEIISGNGSRFRRLFIPKKYASTVLAADSSFLNLVQYDDFCMIPSLRDQARIQTFRDKIDFCGSKDKIVTQIGNAVPVQLAAGVADFVNKFYLS